MRTLVRPMEKASGSVFNVGYAAVRPLFFPGGRVHSLIKELRFALRPLLKAPGFTVTVVLALALGIGATTAIFSLVEGILLRPLPFNNPDRLVLLGDHLGSGPNAAANAPVTAREIGTYSNTSSAFSSLGGYFITTYELSGGAIPE